MPSASARRRKKYKYGMPGLSLQDNLMATHDWYIDAWGFELFLFGETEAGHELLDGNEPGVEFQMANRLIKNIIELQDKNPTRPILIHMKSCGGFWEQGMAIYEAIRFCKNPVTILNYTHARSMTSMIFQAADKRIMMPHSYFMIHEGTESHSGTYKQVKSALKQSEKAKEIMMDIYVDTLKNRGRKFARSRPENIRKMLQEQMNEHEDVYLTAEQAVAAGFADSIFDGNWENLCKHYPRKRKK